LVDLTNNKNKIYENPKAGMMKQQSKPKQKKEKDKSRQ
jgi:hypothetical protein